MGSLMSILITVIVGGIVGIVASRLMKVKQDSYFHNVILGILGSFLGSFILDFFNISGGDIVHFIASVLGAMIVIYLIKIIRH